jgi:hypothetical protein
MVQMRRVIPLLILWIVLVLIFWGTFMFLNRPDAPRLSTTWVALAFPLCLPLILILRRLCRRFLPRGRDRLEWIRGDVAMILIAIAWAPLFLTGFAIAADGRWGLKGDMLLPVSVLVLAWAGPVAAKRIVPRVAHWFPERWP